MERLVHQYLRWHAASGHSPKTIRHHQTTLSLFRRWLHERRLPDELDADAVRLWQQEQHEAGLTADTVATRTRSLKAFARWCVEEGVYDVDPLRRVRLPKLHDKPKDVLTVEEVDKLLATCDKHTLVGLRDAAIMTLLLSTGIRIAELLDLKVADVDWKTGLVLIRQGKGGKFRVVPLGTKAERAIDRYLAKRRDDLPHLFLRDDGNPMTYEGAKMLFRRRGAQAGVHANAHKWRHTFAVLFLRNGGTLHALKTLLGHQSFEITAHYGRLAGVDLREQHAIADPARKLKK